MTNNQTILFTSKMLINSFSVLCIYHTYPLHFEICTKKVRCLCYAITVYYNPNFVLTNILNFVAFFVAVFVVWLLCFKYSVCLKSHCKLIAVEVEMYLKESVTTKRN